MLVRLVWNKARFITPFTVEFINSYYFDAVYVAIFIIVDKAMSMKSAFLLSLSHARLVSMTEQ